MINLFKFTGIILSFVTCTLVGFYQASQIKRRRELLVEFQELMQHISTEMGYFKEPLPIIFQQIQQRQASMHQNSPTAILLRQCCLPSDLTTQHVQNHDNFCSLWKGAIEETYKDEPLNVDDILIMTKCGSFLGQSDFESQKGHFALLQGELEKQIREAEENIKTKGSLYSKAGISVGAVIAIALI